MGEIQNAINSAVNTGIAATVTAKTGENIAAGLMKESLNEGKGNQKDVNKEYRELAGLSSVGRLPAQRDEEMYNKALANSYLKMTGKTRFQVGMTAAVNRLVGKEIK